MNNRFKAFISFVLAFMMMQGVYAASGISVKQNDLYGGSIATGNLNPVVMITPRPEKVIPTPEPTPTPEPFYSDVTEDDWYYPAIKAVTEKKYMDGTNDTNDDALTFEPGGKLTRAMFVTILYRLAGSPAAEKEAAAPTAEPEPSEDNKEAKPTAKPKAKATPKPTAEPQSFKDVKKDMWYSDAIAWATAAKIAEGTDKKNFSPAKNITREQAVVMLYRYAKYKKTDTSKEANLLKYKDYSKIGEYAIDAFSWACGMGIIDGQGSSKKLEPTSGVTRAQAAKMIAVYAGIMPKDTKKSDSADKTGKADTPKATDKPESTAKPAASEAPDGKDSDKKRSSHADTDAASPTPKPTAKPEKATPAPAATAKPKNLRNVIKLAYDPAESTATTRVIKVYYQEITGIYGATFVLNFSTNNITDADITCVQTKDVSITSNSEILAEGRYAVNITAVSEDPVSSPDALYATLTLKVPADIGEFTVNLDEKSNLVDQDFGLFHCSDPGPLTIPKGA